MTNQAFRFNPPPGWPPPPQGWVPEPQWRPDPAWPPAPPGWNFWLPAEPAAPPPTLAGRAEPAATSPPPPGGGEKTPPRLPPLPQASTEVLTATFPPRQRPMAATTPLPTPAA